MRADRRARAPAARRARAPGARRRAERQRRPALPRLPCRYPRLPIRAGAACSAFFAAACGATVPTRTPCSSSRNGVVIFRAERVVDVHPRQALVLRDLSFRAVHHWGIDVTATDSSAGTARSSVTISLCACFETRKSSNLAAWLVLVSPLIIHCSRRTSTSTAWSTRSSGSGNQVDGRGQLPVLAQELRQDERALIPHRRLLTLPEDDRGAVEVHRVDALEEPAVVDHFFISAKASTDVRIGPLDLVGEQLLVHRLAVLVDEVRRPRELRLPLLLVREQERSDPVALEDVRDVDELVPCLRRLQVVLLEEVGVVPDRRRGHVVGHEPLVAAEGGEFVRRRVQLTVPVVLLVVRVERGSEAGLDHRLGPAALPREEHVRRVAAFEDEAHLLVVVDVGNRVGDDLDRPLVPLVEGVDEPVRPFVVLGARASVEEVDRDLGVALRGGGHRARHDREHHDHCGDQEHRVRRRLL